MRETQREQVGGGAPRGWLEDGLQHPGPSSPERRNYGVFETRSQAGDKIIIEEF